MKWWSKIVADDCISINARQFYRFLFVGAFGFCVDGGLLTVLMKSGWEILSARTLSFLSAATFTWLLNRLWTFKFKRDIGIRKEYFSYIVMQVVGALINLAVFFTLIKLYPALRDMPLIPFAFGSAMSLAFNYVVSNKYVFKL